MILPDVFPVPGHKCLPVNPRSAAVGEVGWPMRQGVLLVVGVVVAGHGSPQKRSASGEYRDLHPSQAAAAV